MGDYIVHFDDGSEHLMHYGKTGMHWGEWNEETRRRYELEGKIHDLRTGGVYNDSLSGHAARALDNIGETVKDLLEHPSYTLSGIRQKAFKQGEALVNGVLRGLKDASETAKTEARYLVEGYTPTVRTDADKATKRFYKRILPSVNKVKYVKPRSGTWTQEQFDKANNIDYQGYRNSKARKVRNFFGQK